MIQRMQKRFGENHPDAGKVTFVGIPILIVAAQHDRFRDEVCTKLSFMPIVKNFAPKKVPLF